jgi:hypothetical protein
MTPRSDKKRKTAFDNNAFGAITIGGCCWQELSRDMLPVVDFTPVSVAATATAIRRVKSGANARMTLVSCTVSLLLLVLASSYCVTYVAGDSTVAGNVNGRNAYNLYYNGERIGYSSTFSGSPTLATATPFNFQGFTGGVISMSCSNCKCYYVLRCAVL